MCLCANKEGSVVCAIRCHNPHLQRLNLVGPPLALCTFFFSCFSISTLCTSHLNIHNSHPHFTMCRLWSTTTLALSWATLLCAAYPQPQLWSQNQQIPFSAHHPNNRLSPTFNNHQNPDVSTYARFDDEQVLRVDVTDLAQLKQLEQTVEVMNEFPSSCRHIPSALPFPRFNSTHTTTVRVYLSHQPLNFQRHVAAPVLIKSTILLLATYCLDRNTTSICGRI